jgi:hypothetical protein
MVGADGGEANVASPALKLLDLLAAVLKDNSCDEEAHEATVTEEGVEVHLITSSFCLVQTYVSHTHTPQVHHWDAFFQLLHVCFQRDSSRRKQYFVVKGVIPALIRRISTEIDLLHETEHSFSGDRVVPRAPYLLYGLARLLLALVEEPAVLRLFKRRGMAQQALNAHLRLRGLKLERTTLSEECARVLLQVVESVFTHSDDDKRALLQAYVTALQQTPETDKRDSSFILDQMCSIIKPAKVEPNCQVVLKKAATQEDFIRGSMHKNPYSLADFDGNTMEDMKNKIVRDLGLPDAANMFELLVDKRIINQSLPITQVYEKVWLPSQRQGVSPFADVVMVGDLQLVGYEAQEEVKDVPMVVTYRLTGLDGEATEELVESLSSEEQAQDPEVEYALASAMGECAGLSVLLRRVSQLVSLGHDVDRRLLERFIRALVYCCQLQSNRAKLLRLNAKPGAHVRLGSHCINALVKQLVLSLGSSVTLDLAKELLGVIDSLLREAELEQDRAPAIHQEGDMAQEDVVPVVGEAAQLQRLLRALATFVDAKPEDSKFAQEILRVLPSLTYGVDSLTEAVCLPCFFLFFFTPLRGSYHSTIIHRHRMSSTFILCAGDGCYGAVHRLASF